MCLPSQLPHAQIRKVDTKKKESGEGRTGTGEWTFEGVWEDMKPEGHEVRTILAHCVKYKIDKDNPQLFPESILYLGNDDAPSKALRDALMPCHKLHRVRYMDKVNIL